MFVTSNYFQSFSVNDFVNFTGYNPNNGPLTLEIWQKGESTGSPVQVNIFKIQFYLDWSIITTTSSTGATGPTLLQASTGHSP